MAVDGRERVELEAAQRTLVMTLAMRDLDARSWRPVLDDPYAGAVLARLDHDVRGLWRLRPGAGLIATRGRLIDDAVAAFLGEHRDGLVVQLAAGLDSRPYRLARPSGSTWVDVDFPAVVDVRQRVYAALHTPLPGHTTVGTDVLAPGWVEELPDDRPALVVAEGLSMYLDPDDLPVLLDRLHRRLPGVVVVLDAVAPGSRRLGRASGLLRSAGTAFTADVGHVRAAAAYAGLAVVGDTDLVAESARRRLGRVLGAPVALASGLAGRVPVLDPGHHLLRLAPA